jgi:TatD DNase family protein
MDLFDTHCHPHFENFLPSPDEILEAAEVEGVKKVIAVGTTVADSQKAIKFAANHERVWAAAGVHPHEAGKLIADKNIQNKLSEILDSSSIVAIGEVGLDYFKNYSNKDDQLAALRRQIELGIGTGLPFIFHIRDAWHDFWPVFDSYPGLKGIIHSFSASVKELEEALARDLYIGLNGIMTFTKDQAQLEAARQVPLDRLMLETDAPFLAPAPFRGQRCEPKHVRVIAEFLARLRSENPLELAAATTANAMKVFSL